MFKGFLMYTFKLLSAISSEKCLPQIIQSYIQVCTIRIN